MLMPSTFFRIRTVLLELIIQHKSQECGAKYPNGANYFNNANENQHNFGKKFRLAMLVLICAISITDAIGLIRTVSQRIFYLHLF